MSEHYLEQIASLRQAALDRRQREQVEYAQTLAESVRTEEQAAAKALAEGDRETALMHAEWANEQQSELDQALAKLPPPPPVLSETQQEFVRQRPQLFGTADGWASAARAHDYVTGFMNVESGSPEYIDCMSRLIDAPGFEPTPTPDAVIEAINKTSKHQLTAKEYNKGVTRLLSAKKTGGYPGR